MNILVNGVSYSYHVEGNGEPILLLHGFTGRKENWSNLIELLKSHYQVITVDLIGHGKTDSPAGIEHYSMEAVCDALKVILQKLDVKKAHVLGYSMGGRVALAFACTYPNLIQSLTLESSSPGLQTDIERKARYEADEKLARKIEQHGVETFIDFWENIPLFETQKKLSVQKREAIRNQRLQNDPTGLANSLRGMGTGKQPSYWDMLSSLHIPVLFICGELDEKFCRIAEEMKKRLQHATIYNVPNAGHAIHVEQPRIFGKIVLEHIQEHHT